MIAKIILKREKIGCLRKHTFWLLFLQRFFESFLLGIIGEDRDFELNLRDDYDVESCSKLFLYTKLRGYNSLKLGEYS